MKFVMDKSIIKKALEEAQHELTTLNNLIVTDNPKSGVVWTTDVSNTLKSIEQALSEF